MTDVVSVGNIETRVDIFCVERGYTPKKITTSSRDTDKTFYTQESDIRPVPTVQGRKTIVRR